MTAIPPERWAEPVWLIGGGPSAGPVVEWLRDHRQGVVVAINDSAKLVPWADVLFTADGTWLKTRADLVSSFRGHVIAALPDHFPTPSGLDIERVSRRDGAVLSGRPDVCFYANNSGFGALNAVVARSARLIFLAGYDMNGPGHWHGGYEWKCRFGVNDYPRWASGFDMIADDLKESGVTVINLNPQSAIRPFRLASVEEVPNLIFEDMISRAMRPAVVVAHPDDESLWCGGLLARYPKPWTVICCSIPRRDPVRAWKFFHACDALGVTGMLYPFEETAPTHHLPWPEIDLGLFDLIVTHGEHGEYGHRHHKDVHDFVKSVRRDSTVVTFGYRPGEEGEFSITLNDDEWAVKERAIRAYDHISPSDGIPKGEALINRYSRDFDLRRETYDVV